MATPTRRTPRQFLDALSESADVTQQFTSDVVERNVDPYYRFEIPKRSGEGTRKIDSPTRPLRKLQRVVYKKFIAPLPVDEHAFGYVSGRSPVECARQHLNAAWLVRIDLESFFNSIDERQVYYTLLPHFDDKFPAFALSRIATRSTARDGTSRVEKFKRPYSSERRSLYHPLYEPKYLGYLPQGASTSGHLANMVTASLDRRLAALASMREMRYSRYADDLFFSATTRLSHATIHRTVVDISQSIRSTGFRPNRLKTRILGFGTPTVMLGILVNGSEPRLTRQRRNQIDMALFGATRHGVSAHARHAGFDAPEQFMANLSGLISYAHDVNPDWADVRYKAFNALT